MNIIQLVVPQHISFSNNSSQFTTNKKSYNIGRNDQTTVSSFTRKSTAKETKEQKKHSLQIFIRGRRFLNKTTK